MPNSLRTRSNSRRRAPWLAFVIAGVVALASCGGPAPREADPNLFLMIADASANRVEVLSAVDDPAKLAPNTTASFSIGTEGSVGMAAFGPDGRIYVTDWSGARILVFDADTALSSANPSPAAVITSPALMEPLTMAFTADGDLWVADRRGSTQGSPVPNRLVKLHDVTAAVGHTELAATAVLDFRSSTTSIFRYHFLDALLLDEQGNLWMTDLFDWTVSRIDDPNDLTGDHADFVPDLQFASVNYSDAPLSAVRNPTGLAMDAQGRLYVGNRGQTSVARFDAPYSITSGDDVVTASASIHVAGTGIPNTSLVAIDSSANLWVASASCRPAYLPSSCGSLPPAAAGPSST